MSKLTEKQRKFVEAYMGKAAGNATEAARLAGYAGSYKTLQNVGSENLSKPIIAEAIKKRQDKDPLVATRQQRQQFWSEVMNDEAQEMAHRLKASEILGRSQADFIDRQEHSGTLTIRVEYGDGNEDN